VDQGRWTRAGTATQPPSHAGSMRHTAPFIRTRHSVDRPPQWPSSRPAVAGNLAHAAPRRIPIGLYGAARSRAVASTLLGAGNRPRERGSPPGAPGTPKSARPPRISVQQTHAQGETRAHRATSGGARPLPCPTRRLSPPAELEPTPPPRGGALRAAPTQTARSSPPAQTARSSTLARMYHLGPKRAVSAPRPSSTRRGPPASHDASAFPRWRGSELERHSLMCAKHVLARQRLGSSAPP
jgi:hypothetical protein